MAWQNPKLDWTTNPKSPMAADFNRIEGNIKAVFDEIGPGTQNIYNSYLSMGITPASQKLSDLVVTKNMNDNKAYEQEFPADLTLGLNIPKGYHNGLGGVPAYTPNVGDTVVIKYDKGGAGDPTAAYGGYDFATNIVYGVVNKAGAYRIKYTAANEFNWTFGPNAFYQTYINDVAAGPRYDVGGRGSFSVNHVEEYSLNAGDRVHIRGYSDTGSAPMYIRDFRICCDWSYVLNIPWGNSGDYK